MVKRTLIALSCVSIVVGVITPSFAEEQNSPVSAQPVFTRAPWNPPLETVAGKGERVFAVLQTNEAVLYSTKRDGLPNGAGPNNQRRWYLVTHMFSKDPKANEKQLQQSIFQEPPQYRGDFPFPSEPVHLGNTAVDTSQAIDGSVVLMFVPDEDDGKVVQPRRARGVFSYIGRRVTTGKWFCLAPALWWGDGVTEAMVQSGCNPTKGWGWDFSFTCDGAAAAEPDCVGYNQKKKQGQKLPAPQP
jgi:hypothetical protein